MGPAKELGSTLLGFTCFLWYLFSIFIHLFFIPVGLALHPVILGVKKGVELGEIMAGKGVE